MQIVLSTGQVYTFKLNSGEELVAKVVQSGGDTIGIENPVSIAPGQHGMQLIPSLFTADPDGEIRLNTSSVALYGLTEDSVKMKYIEATTGIQIPDKKILVG
jgi:hypothetical protein